jgi:hypothetical protein
MLHMQKRILEDQYDLYIVDSSENSFSNSQMDLLHSTKPPLYSLFSSLVFFFQVGSWGNCELEVAVYAALDHK